jgi:hypothetical protein
MAFNPSRRRTNCAFQRLLENDGVLAMTKMPPVPPQNRSPKGVGSQNEERTEDPKLDRKENNAKQGQQGNIRQNTTHQGYQQDR